MNRELNDCKYKVIKLISEFEYVRKEQESENGEIKMNLTCPYN